MIAPAILIRDCGNGGWRTQRLAWEVMKKDGRSATSRASAFPSQTWERGREGAACKWAVGVMARRAGQLLALLPECARVGIVVRWCHSFLVRPPATGCDAFGVGNGVKRVGLACDESCRGPLDATHDIFLAPFQDRHQPLDKLWALSPSAGSGP